MLSLQSPLSNRGNELDGFGACQGDELEAGLEPGVHTNGNETYMTIRVMRSSSFNRGGGSATAARVEFKRKVWQHELWKRLLRERQPRAMAPLHVLCIVRLAREWLETFSLVSSSQDRWQLRYPAPNVMGTTFVDIMCFHVAMFTVAN